MPYPNNSQTDERQNRTPACSTDYLKIRLRRMVISIMKQQQEGKSSCPFAMTLAGKDSRLLIKGIWLTLSLMCFAVFTYQLYDRISYYFTYPIAVDVYIIQPTVQKFPDLTVCYPGLQRKVLKEREYSICNIEMLHYLILGFGRPVEDIWKTVNTSTGLISAQEVIGKLKLPLKDKDQPLVWGTCSTFRSRITNEIATGHHYFNITLAALSNCDEKLPIKVYIHSHGEGPLSRNGVSFIIEKQGELIMKKRKFAFVNRKGNPCLTTSQHQECLDDCFIKLITEKGADKCRFPFYPLKMNNISGQCVLTSENMQNWLIFYGVLNGQIKPIDCQCTRKCEHTAFNEWRKTGESPIDSWTLVLHFDSPYETLIKERLSYDLLDLFCDVGGNSGLFIGVSLLSLFQTGYTALQSVRKCCRPKPNPFSMKDPLYRKVVKTYHKWIKMENYKNKLTTKPNKWKSSAVFLKSFVVFICVCLLILLCGNRLYFYFQYPMKTIVSISFNKSLVVPTLFLCYGDEKVMQRQMEIASSENISNPCDVNVWDLFNLPNIVSGDIWRNGAGFKIPFSISSYDVLALYDGSCYELIEAATFSTDPYWQYASGLPGQCGTEFVKMYIKLPTEMIDYHRYVYLSATRGNSVKYLIKEIRLEKSGLPCISPEENEICLQNCLKKKLFNLTSCRLPYMPKAELPTCHSSSSVRQAHEAFRDLFFVSENTENCNCLPKCLTRIIETTDVVTEKGKKKLRLAYTAQHKTVESYVFIPAYSFVKLLCDIGGFVGSILGLCILEMIGTAESFIDARIKKRGYY